MVQSINNDALAEAGYFETVGPIGSFLEGRVIEEVFGLEGTSTVRNLQIASNLGIPLVAIDSTNMGVIDRLEYDDDFKASLRDVVSSGKSLVIPERGIDSHGFSGTGWIEEDPLTGAAGYMISGELAGGKSTKSDAGSANPAPSQTGVWVSLFMQFSGMMLGAVEVRLQSQWAPGADVAGALAAGLTLASLLNSTLALSREQMTPDDEYALFLTSYIFSLVSSAFVVAAAADAMWSFVNPTKLVLIGVVISLVDLAATIMAAFGEEAVSLVSGWTRARKLDPQLTQ